MHAAHRMPCAAGSRSCPCIPCRPCPPPPLSAGTRTTARRRRASRPGSWRCAQRAWRTPRRRATSSECVWGRCTRATGRESATGAHKSEGWLSCSMHVYAAHACLMQAYTHRVEDGVACAAGGPGRIAHGAWRKADGGWRMADDERRLPLQVCAAQAGCVPRQLLREDGQAGHAPGARSEAASLPRCVRRRPASG